jgi:hypothetical protein
MAAMERHRGIMDMLPSRKKSPCSLAIVFLLSLAQAAHAQAPMELTGPDAEGGPTTRDSGVGYIDSAVPFSQFRLRYDDAFHNNRPTRAEFFYAKGQPPGGPGLPKPETFVDYQDISSYLEIAADNRMSAFIEAPVRFLNPQINQDATGFADMNAGFKYAFFQNPDWIMTGQFRTYIPTGDAHLGLGTRHVSLEPAFLFNHNLASWLLLEGEFRYWIPVGGTDFEGDVIRYGLGLTFGRRQADHFWVTPVTEVVGWTVLGGKESAGTTIISAAGDTIVNFKVGVRFGLGDRADIYTGYGRPLTGDVWYKDIFRVEFRLFF